MNIKIPEAICQSALGDLQLVDELKKRSQEAMQTAQSLADQAKGIELAVQSRTYRALDLQPVAGDVLQFAEGELVRKDPDAPKDPTPPNEDPKS